MNNFLKILFWILTIVFINFFGRYLFLEFFEGGYSWIKHFYIVLAGTIGASISIAIFFLFNYFIHRKKQIHFSLNKTRFLIMFFAIILAFAGERIYLFLSDYFLMN
ncbi:hypothetical protein [Aureivirga marina]|uniref:hypothetical protein n=1 Tax=Aureivirga marina TaxID=1182451 RepID=UPI0018C8F361|nr:hypothetical protein [Aureivirga marina]